MSYELLILEMAMYNVKLMNTKVKFDFGINNKTIQQFVNLSIVWIITFS